MKIFNRILVLILILLFSVGNASSDFGGFSGSSNYSRSSNTSTRSTSSPSSTRSSSSTSRPSRSTSRTTRNYDSSGGFNTIAIPLGAGSVTNRSNVRNENTYLNEDDDDDDDSSCIGLFIFVAILLFFVMRSRTKAKRDRQILLEENSAPKIILEPMDEYSKIDPDFDDNELISHIANLYVQMQDAWTAKNLEILRPYLADTFYNQMNRQLDDYRRNNKTDHTENIAVLGVFLKGFRQSKGTDYIIAGLTSRITSYVTDDLTGKVISGDKKKELFMEYELELSRKSGVITQHSHETKSEKCPNCGAPIDVNATAKCTYCGSIIKSQNINWVVSGMQGISQKSA